MEFQGILGPWVVEVVLLSFRAWRGRGRPPLPGELAATFVVFGGLSFIPNKKIAATAGWGFVVASALNVLPQALSPKYQPTGVNVLGGPANVVPGQSQVGPPNPNVGQGLPTPGH